MDLTYLLSKKGIDTQTSPVLVLRHVPKEPTLRRALPWLAAEKPDLFNSYQQTQSVKAEKQLARADYLASFIGHRPGEALFVGLYATKGSRRISVGEFWRIPANNELRKLGMNGLAEDGDRQSVLWFDLALTDLYSDWKGKLVINWPPPEIAWARWAGQNEFAVKAIFEESALVAGMPPWNELFLGWDDLRNLPRSWVKKLEGWRGIYFILDGTDGKGYIGSAYGDENLYGRWSNYANSGNGGNKLLRERSPNMFRFSILELCSPSEKPESVIQLENNWKDRLHTREFGLNAN